MRDDDIIKVPGTMPATMVKPGPGLVVLCRHLADAVIVEVVPVYKVLGFEGQLEKFISLPTVRAPPWHGYRW